MKPLELYLHIPFCIRKCAYCDFNSAGWGREVQRAYFKALRREIALSARGREQEEVVSIFFGGGTPSLPPANEICQTLSLIRQTFALALDCEITMEANPGTLTREKLMAYKEAGINRISLGCQAVQDSLLKRIGRIHTFKEVKESIELIRACGFTNLNVDLMSGLPDQTLEDYRESLRTIAELGVEHISAYSLILEEGTPLYEEKDPLHLPDEETERQMYEDTARILETYGFCQYEISNYAKEGYACRHNIGYWERTNYLGFGLSAASLDGSCRWTNTGDMQEYCTLLGEGADGLPWSKGDQMAVGDPLQAIRRDCQRLSAREEMEETMFLGLRMNRGVSRAHFLQTFGQAMDEVYGDVISSYKKNGFLVDSPDGDRLSLSRQGISVSNVILADFLLD